MTQLYARLRLLRILAVLLVVPALLSGCGWYYGPGLTRLGAGDGWFPLPIQRWLTSSGVETTALLICRPDVCVAPSVAILMEADATAARQLDAALASDRVLTARKARPVLRRIGLAPKTIIPQVEAISRIERFMHHGHPALRIAMLPKSGSGRAAYAVVISQETALGRRYALAVTTDPGLALEQASLVLGSVPYGG
jgi:hypothetical protein